MYYASKPILRIYRWKNSTTQSKINNKNLAFDISLTSLNLYRQCEKISQGYVTSLQSHERVINDLGSSPLVPIQTGLISLFEGEEKSLHHVALVAKVSGSQPTMVLQLWQKTWHLWLSCARLHSGTKRWLIHVLFFHCSTMQMAVSVKKDCCDPESLLPW